jgi:microcompartment protein PduB
MDNNDFIQNIMDEVEKRLNSDGEKGESIVAETGKGCALTEYVGTAVGDTIGLVIANVDSQLHEKLGIDPKYRSIGIVGARTGAGPHAMAADEAVKASNTELVKFEMPRDTKGGAGHGSFAVFGGEDVSDVRRAVEIMLDALNNTYFGDIYMNDCGHLELQYTARASQVLADYLGADMGKSWGLICGAPASIGLVMSDTAVKSANVEVALACSPADGTSFSNEYMIMVKGDSGAVKQAVMAGREVGLQLLEALGGKVDAAGESYIK